jgi:hypothetical protein
MAHQLILLIYWAAAYFIQRKNKEALVVATKEIGLDVNSEKTKYTVITRDQNAERSHNINIHNGTVERVEQFKYLGILPN